MILGVNHIRFAYPSRPVLDDASFSVDKGE